MPPQKADTVKFQSTLPARGATVFGVRGFVDKLFQSTLPARGATMMVQELADEGLFQSTLPARGATSYRRHCP